MEHKLRMQIKETVREILEESDMETTTEHQIRRLASNKLDLDLDKSEYKAYVRHVLSAKRKVTIQNFRGANLVSIREYYYDGISLNEEQWSALRKNIPAIEKAVKDMQDRDI
ncbi:hypothetical protein SADUNF_Sadunf01G0069200 [Salix dunnii]|uniref:DEK-C domain-containing protein n=1 Tax=Salix dunnii TaxID=1413687 RepID=A0A835TMG9_9ROSI|nr:hypothetical protein SADUNF_Sadunf01G0069200 [Salix dunnii]